MIFRVKQLNLKKSKNKYKKVYVIFHKEIKLYEKNTLKYYEEVKTFLD